MMYTDYSEINRAAIRKVLPQATELNGFVTWKNKGYTVNKGSAGIQVWFPVRFNAEGEAIGFCKTTVFDISQVTKTGDPVKHVKPSKPADYKPARKITISDILRG
jgi:hypothetical protein